MKRGIVFFLLVFAACSSVDRVYIKPGLETNELKFVKRIALVVDPASAAGDDSEIRSRILLFRTREHLIHHSEYITLKAKMDAKDLLALCKKQPELNGVLVQKVRTAERRGSDLRLGIVSGLYDCRSGTLLWEAEASKTYTMNDSDFATLIAGDVKRFGDAAQRYSAPFFRMIKDLYERLPMPELTDEEKLEKVEADSQ